MSRALRMLFAALALSACVARTPGAAPPRAWLALLAAAGEDALAERLAARLVCVDPRASEAGVAPDGCLVVPPEALREALADSRTLRRLVARMAHLALHRPGFGALPADAPRGCAAWLERMRQSEARALAVEARVARALGVPLGDDALAAHRDALATAYAARCRGAAPQ